MTFGLLVGSRNFCKLLWVSCQVFVLLGCDCIHCVNQVLYHYRVSMIVARFTSFTENFVIRCYSITKVFRCGHDCTSAPSARRPRNLASQADIAISVLREVSEDTMLTPIPHLLAALKVIHEKNWKRLGVLEHYHLQMFVELFEPFWQITQRVSSNFFVVIFIWVFGFCWSTRRVSSYFIMHTLTSY